MIILASFLVSFAITLPIGIFLFVYLCMKKLKNTHYQKVDFKSTDSFVN